MTEFEQKGILDLSFKLVYVEESNAIAEEEKKTMMATMETETGEIVKAVAATCGVDAEKLDNVLDDETSTEAS